MRNDFKKADFIIFLVVLSIAVIFLIGKIFRKVDNYKGVVVRISGEEMYYFDKPGEWKISNKDGKYITTLHYDGVFIWVTESNCPDKICEKTGKVKPGGSIICVPNRTLIEFKKTNLNIDVETW